MTGRFPNQFPHLKKRFAILQAIRLFFIAEQFTEVDTPLRCPGVIPEAHIDPVGCEGQYIQASPELCMKRMLSQGWDRIFQICKAFRKNERGRRHLPEFTLLEWYMKNKTYLDLMDQCERLFRSIAGRIGTAGVIHYQDKAIRLDLPWKRVTVQQAFERMASKSMDDALSDNSFDEIISFEIEPQLGFEAPVFLYDYPASQASLAKLNPQNPDTAQRFELFIAGIELANAFTELTDPVEQKKRFVEDSRIRKASGKPELPLPKKFLSDLEALDSAAGIALGLDRLVMLFCNADRIDAVVPFTPESL